MLHCMPAPGFTGRLPIPPQALAASTTRTGTGIAVPTNWLAKLPGCTLQPLRTLIASLLRAAPV
eukprot:9378142-Lingulodinium_polyedra.AAC.1